MKHYYKIGEISRLYRIGTDSLRYYEELGLLKPARDSNGYRKYHIHDLWRLNVIRDLRELGFSMDKIKGYLDNRTLHSTRLLLEEELEAILDRKRELESHQANIEERLENLREALRQPLGLIEQKELPERRCHMIHGGYTQDDEMDMLIKQLVNKNQDKLYIIGNNRIGSVLSPEGAGEGNFGIYTDVFIIDKNGPDILEGGLYLTVSYQGDNAQNAEYLPRLFAAAEERGVCVCGPVLELLWSDIHQTAQQQEHITQLQVRCIAKNASAAAGSDTGDRK